MPSYYPSRISHWIPLICSSQGISIYHVFEISRFLASEIAALYAVWYSRRQLDADALHDLKSLFPKATAAGIPTEEVFQGEKKWFLRVDYCSAKDSEAGHSIVENVEDIIDRLYTSMRAVRAIRDVLEEDPLEKPKIILMPFNPAMNPSRESRVFQDPPLFLSTVGGRLLISTIRHPPPTKRWLFTQLHATSIKKS
ncbi:hypothetical protein VTN96DRAFT_6167 [Rasamsonia emersonii]